MVSKCDQQIRIPSNRIFFHLVSCLKLKIMEQSKTDAEIVDQLLLRIQDILLDQKNEKRDFLASIISRSVLQ